MKHFRKVWTPEINQWLLDHKDMIKSEMYKLFLETYPECNDVTYTAFKNQCSRVGASYTVNNCWRGDRKPRPLYSEQIKKGYIRIKIAQPNVWITKSKWVYMETHPYEDFSERSIYIFLDGNNRNFNPNNIERLTLSEMAHYSRLGGCCYGNPEITKLRVILAKQRHALYEAGEKAGLTVDYGKTKSCRCFKSDLDAKRREYTSRSYVKERRRKLAKERRERMKIENPEKYEKIKLQHREYLKVYNQRKGEERNGITKDNK